MMKFRSKGNENAGPPPPNTVVGVGSSFRGTLMVTGTFRVDGEFEGDILNCERLEVGEHGVMRADVEVKEALILGRVDGNVRALGTIELRSGARVIGDLAAMSVVMEPGVHFTGRCTMLDAGSEGVEMGAEMSRGRDHGR
uniref:Polymer-forming cytoskeletal protein n=1 Tax=Eiseniibacteriota bacterium TaxID=2212470 RepID=A0A832I5R5_UNCEI